MKILIAAFACAPNTGSEPGVGWRWAAELAKQHEVFVVTDATRRTLIEPYLAEHPIAGLHVEYFRPLLLRAVPLNSWTAQLLYMAWQFGLLDFAKRLHHAERFNIAMHVTYGVFRHPSFLGYLGIPFVFGPLGGGEDAPLRLKRSIHWTEKLKEMARTAVNKIALFDPVLWLAYAKATTILVKTNDTRRALPWPFRKRALVYPEIGIDSPGCIEPSRRAPHQLLRVLFVGRLLGWKGAHLAIRAVGSARKQGVPIDFTLVGRGPYESELRRISRDLGEHGSVNWVSHIPQQELFGLYRTMHCLLFPSLHDSSGNVVLEAQAYGIPVICLDIGGPATLVTDQTAVVIRTNCDEATLVNRMASALSDLHSDENRRATMAEAAIAHASTFTWRDRAFGALSFVSAFQSTNPLTHPDRPE